MKKILSLPSSIRSYVSQISLLSLYPLLLAIYPIVFLYSHNISELTLNVIYVPILVAILITSLVMLVANLLVKNWHKTALIVALSLLVFYFYQPLVLQLPETLATIGEISLTRGKVFLPLIALAYLVVVTLVVKTSWQGLAKTAQPLNLLFAVLIGFSLFQIGQIEITRATNSFDAEDAARSSAIDAGDMSKPDIYYFVFDRYAGQKTLNDYYEFDNSPFLNELTSKGFYVAENSHTNYPSTELSIASSLSMDYHESRAEKGQNMDFTTDIYPKIWNSQAISYFKDLGYKYYQVSSRYMPTSYSNIADEQFIPKSKSKLNLDEFTVQLLQSTVINVFGNELLDQVVNLDYYDAFLNAHNYQRTIVPRIIEKDGPKVVFTHVLLPHDPHVVNKDCESISSHDSTGYNKVLKQ